MSVPDGTKAARSGESTHARLRPKISVSNGELHTAEAAAEDASRLMRKLNFDYGRTNSTPVGIDCRKVDPETHDIDDALPRSRSSSKKTDLMHSTSTWRANSLYGTSPVLNFGPKASIMKSSTTFVTVQDPSSQRLTWTTPPTRILVIKKILDDDILDPFKDIVTWLIEKKKLKVFVEESVLKEHIFKVDNEWMNVAQMLRTFKEGHDNLDDKIDLIICLGGDGTLLYASSLFQQSVPPVMAFHLGSLGFLAPFRFSEFRVHVESVIEGHAALVLRQRFHVSLRRTCGAVTPGAPATAAVVVNGSSGHDQSRDDSGRQMVTTHTVLNEVVINRGTASFLCQLELYIDGRLVTTVQGDGIIISTPTGSTAYACAAGASMVHPNVPAIIIVPICPHSLSFRPVVVPAGVEVRVSLSPDARNTALVSFDGRNGVELSAGDSVLVTTSIHPVPSVCNSDPIDDWFESLADCLHWNVRRPQLSIMSHRDSKAFLVTRESPGLNS